MKFFDRKHDVFQSRFKDSTIHANDENDSFTPEELRQQAQEEKKKYHTLKKEGKGEEALQAFKRGKELERRSEALELSLRKSRRRAVTIALKDLGWSDADLQDADRKRSKMNLEGELSTLLGETQKIKNTQNESVVGAEQMQVLAHKRRALALKRKGKLEESEDEFELAKSLEI